MYTSLSLSIYIYIYTHIHIYTYTYIHTVQLALRPPGAHLPRRPQARDPGEEINIVNND